MDVKNKAKIFRGLKLISYFIGLPLVMFYIWRDTQGLSKDGLKVAICIWAAITVCQVVCSFLFKKNTYRRPRIAAITLACALILTICTPYAINIVYGARLAELNEKYKDAPVTKYTYDELLVNYKSVAGSSESISGTFSSVYNLNAGNKGSNIISVTKDSEGNTVNCDYQGKDGKFGYADYSPNGLLADGYVFSTAVAANLLKQYYAAYDELLERYGTPEKVQEEYYKALRNAAKSTDYKAYILEDDIKLYIAEAEKYNLVSENSSARLDAVLRALGKNVGDELKKEITAKMGTVKTLADTILAGILDLDATAAELYGFATVEDFKADAKYNEYKLDLGTMLPQIVDVLFDDLLNKNLSLSGLEGQLYDVVEDLYSIVYVKVQRGINYYKGIATPVPDTIEISSVYELFGEAKKILTALGLSIDLEEVLGITVTDDTELAEVLAVVLTDKLGMSLINEPSSYTLNGLVTELLGNFVGIYPYQHPMVKPSFMFIEDETMQTYAWALYEGQVHGKFCSSVLISDTTIGKETPASQAFTAADIDRMMVIDAYEAELKPLLGWIALRVLLINYAPLIIGALILVNIFGYFEDKQMAILVEGEYDEEVK